MAVTTLDAALDAPVRLDLLGGFRLRVGEREVTVSDVAQRVIAYVALQDRPVRRDRLAGSLWLDKTDARAGANLRSALWRLRRQGADVMDLGESSVRLRGGVQVDVREVTDWAWRVIEGRGEPADLDRIPPAGDLLSDWYDEWVVLERERLHQLRLHALEGICRGLLESGRTARAIDAALAVVNVDPLRETAYRLLIEAHVHEGNWSEAVRARRRYVSVVRDQLGLDVSDRLADLIPGTLPH
jgi:DNA-binding SARP family transcriptional activator